jgi:hypothetical protein
VRTRPGLLGVWLDDDELADHQRGVPAQQRTRLRTCAERPSGDLVSQSVWWLVRWDGPEAVMDGVPGQAGCGVPTEG